MGACAATILDMVMGPCVGIPSSLSEGVRPIRELDDIDALMKTYRARILRFVTYSTGDLDLAETITQDTFLRAYNGREGFRGDCSIKTWLTGIAINVTRDHLRTEKYKFWKRVRNTAVDVHEMSSFLPSDGSSPERQLLAKERVRQLWQILETLSYNQRTVFLMKFSEDMQVNEISESLGMSLNTVRTHLHRALKAVRSKLGENNDAA
jgi:RNA polymerase sigma-70 factor (ECF subfamily)